MHDMELSHEDRQLLKNFNHEVDRMSKIADQITAAAASIAASTTTLQTNGLDDPTLAPAVAQLETAVTALAALVTPPVAQPVAGS